MTKQEAIYWAIEYDQRAKAHEQNAKCCASASDTAYWEGKADEARHIAKDIREVFGIKVQST